MEDLDPELQEVTFDEYLRIKGNRMFHWQRTSSIQGPGRTRRYKIRYWNNLILLRESQYFIPSRSSSPLAREPKIHNSTVILYCRRIIFIIITFQTLRKGSSPATTSPLGTIYQESVSTQSLTRIWIIYLNGMRQAFMMRPPPSQSYFCS